MSEYAGPYISADMDELYLPVEDYSYRLALAEAASWAREVIGAEGRSRYVGKRAVPLHDHADWEEAEGCCPDRPAWCFEVYEA